MSDPASDSPSATPSLRFVVLHHLLRPGGVSADDNLTAPNGAHFDLMIELPGNGDLETFRLPHWPIEPHERLTVTRLRNHRRHYLTYQGDISGDRGRVIRVAEGIAHVTRTLASPDVTVRLLGAGTDMLLKLTQLQDENWLLDRANTET